MGIPHQLDGKRGRIVLFGKWDGHANTDASSLFSTPNKGHSAEIKPALSDNKKIRDMSCAGCMQ